MRRRSFIAALLGAVAVVQEALGLGASSPKIIEPEILPELSGDVETRHILKPGLSLEEEYHWHPGNTYDFVATVIEVPVRDWSKPRGNFADAHRARLEGMIQGAYPEGIKSMAEEAEITMVEMKEERSRPIIVIRTRE
jgi:hypothetical protein